MVARFEPDNESSSETDSVRGRTRSRLDRCASQPAGCRSTDRQDDTLFSSDAVTPPRLGSAARSRAGQRDRANLRLVVDNTVAPDASDFRWSPGSPERSRPAERKADYPVGLRREQSASAPQREQGSTIAGDRARSALERLSAFLARPVRDVVPHRKGSMLDVDYSVGAMAAVALLPVLVVVALHLLPLGATESTEAPGAVDGADLMESELTVVVQPGDTVWSIAGQFAPDGDRRNAVSAIAAANGGSDLVPGQVVVIPVTILGQERS